MIIRFMQRDELPLVWQIDRREITENIYHLRDGKLFLEPELFALEPEDIHLEYVIP